MKKSNLVRVYSALMIFFVTVVIGVLSAAMKHPEATNVTRVSKIENVSTVSEEPVVLNKEAEPSSDIAMSIETKSIVADDSGFDTKAQIDSSRGVYHAIKPCRVYDTRNNTANASTIDAKTVSLRVAGKCGLPGELMAVQVGLTSVANGAFNFVTLWNSGEPIPDASTINVDGSDIRSNSAIVGASSGSIGVYNYSTRATTIIDVYGYWSTVGGAASSGRFVALTPTRIYDSRPTGKVVADQKVTVSMPTSVPADAVAVVANITAVDSSAPGLSFVTVWSGNGPMTDTSAITLDKNGQTRAAGGIYGLTNKTLNIQPSLGAMHILVDVTGYITGKSAPTSLSGRLAITDPARLLDTRSKGKISSGSSVLVANPSPNSATGFVYNLTMVQPNGGGFLTLTRGGEPASDTSNINASRSGEIVANFAITPASANGTSVHTSVGSHVLLDSVGYFTGASNDIPELIQAKLNSLGCNAGGVDGVIGQGTTAAIKRFQAANPPLTVDGGIGFSDASPTFAALMSDNARYCVNLPADSGTGARIVVSQAYNWVWIVAADGVTVRAQGGIIDNPVVNIAEGKGLAKGVYSTCDRSNPSVDTVHGIYYLYNFTDLCSPTNMYEQPANYNMGSAGWKTDRGFHQVPVYIDSGLSMHDEDILGTNVQTSTACIRVGKYISGEIYKMPLGTTVVVK
jgi:peptidoglycan hydrolase-like protein with peptidoglycan-binding domain